MAQDGKEGACPDATPQAHPAFCILVLCSKVSILFISLRSILIGHGD